MAELRDQLRVRLRADLGDVGQIRAGSESINASAAEIARGNEDLSRRTEQQAAALEETASSMEEIAATVRVPVIAAGGIADAAGVRAAMALGAAGVQVGTAYLCADEATTTALHRAALQSEAARHTTLTNVFTGRPARGIVNRVMREMGGSGKTHFATGLSRAAPAFPLATNAMAPLRAAAEKAGRTDFSPLWSGQNATACQSAPAADITRALAAGFKD